MTQSRFPRPTRPAAALALTAALLAPACSGPASTGGGRWFGWFGRAAAGPQATMGLTEADPTVLANEHWILAPVDPTRPIDPLAPRWRHPPLDDLTSRAELDRPNLVPALEHPDPVVRTNAAIGLARWGDARAIAPLVEAVRNPALKTPQRSAAVEALSQLATPLPLASLRELAEQYSRTDGAPGIIYIPELHAELIRGLARHVDATQEPALDAALRVPNAEVRLAALVAWQRSAAPELPPTVVDLRADPDPRIRARVLALLADRRHPRLVELARSAVGDYELQVRLAAIAALGQGGTPEAVAALEKLLIHEPETIRAAAVAALAQAGAVERVLARADDPSWHVRKSVAAALARWPAPEHAALARGYLRDPSSEVRREALLVLEAWPLPLAGPVLLAGMEEEAYLTRRGSAEQLARRWPPARAFALDGPPESRLAQAEGLRQQWQAEFGGPAPIVLASATLPAAPSPRRPSAVPPERLDALERALQPLSHPALAPGNRAVALVPIQGFGPDLVDALEVLLVERGEVIPDAVWQEVLPRLAWEFAALEELRTANDADRQRAAQRLAARAAQEPLRPLLVARLAEVGVAQEDALIWRYLIETVDREQSEPAVRLAYAALSHPSPEVRRLACAWLGKRPDPRHARVLLPALDDPHITVVREAARAAAQPGMLSDPAPLERLLTRGDKIVRLDVARGLARLGVPSGPAALERLSYEPDAELRRQVAVAMGETGDPAFVASLMRLLDDSLGVKQAALDGLPKLVGFDAAATPPDAPPLSLVDRVGAWRRWWELEGRARFANPSGGLRATP